MAIPAIRSYTVASALSRCSKKVLVELGRPNIPVLFDPAQDKEMEVFVASALHSQSGVQSINSILPLPAVVFNPLLLIITFSRRVQNETCAFADLSETGSYEPATLSTRLST